jgi:hypothetical protein
MSLKPAASIRSRCRKFGWPVHNVDGQPRVIHLGECGVETLSRCLRSMSSFRNNIFVYMKFWIGLSTMQMGNPRQFNDHSNMMQIQGHNKLQVRSIDDREFQKHYPQIEQFTDHSATSEGRHVKIDYQAVTPSRPEGKQVSKKASARAVRITAMTGMAWEIHHRVGLRASCLDLFLSDFETLQHIKFEPLKLLNR